MGRGRLFIILSLSLSFPCVMPGVFVVQGWTKKVVPRLRESRLLTPSGRGTRVHAT